MTATRNPSADYCFQLVRAHDLDRYLSTLLADDNKQRALFAIYAFDVEICNIASQVSEPGLGEIRLQWWRDTIEKVFLGKCDDHPVIKELHRAIHQHDLPAHLFLKLIDAHRVEFIEEAISSIDDLKDYLGDTSAGIIDLTSRVLVGIDALELEPVTKKAGFVRGLGRMLTTLPIQVANKQCFIPVDLLKRQNLGIANVLAGENSKGLQLVILQLCHLVADNFDALQREQWRLTKNVLPAFFPASLANLKCKKLTKRRFNPLKQVASVSQLRLQWLLMKNSLFEQL